MTCSAGPLCWVHVWGRTVLFLSGVCGPWEAGAWGNSFRVRAANIRDAY